MQSTIQAIPLDKLIDHPLNANEMSKQSFKKLMRHIGRTSLYEPLVVRPHPDKKGSFQIINGHHRVMALRMLGQDTANCVVWDVDDNEAAILLMTLNRLQGSDNLEKKIQLLNKLKEQYKTVQLTKLLPQTKKQIEALANLKVPAVPSKADENVFARPLVFFVTPEQLQIIESAMSIALETVEGETTAEKKAKALVLIAKEYADKTRHRIQDN